MAEKLDSMIAVIGIDIGKNSFHVVGLDRRGAIVLRQKWSRGQVETRFANMAPCLVGMETLMQDRSPLTRRTLSQRTAGPYMWVRSRSLRNVRPRPLPIPKPTLSRRGLVGGL
jgi:hypothetical protein